MKHFSYGLRTLIFAATLAGFSSTTMADNKALLDLLEVLRNNNSITAQEYEMLKNAAEADAEKSAEVVSTAKEVKESVADMPKVNTKGKLEFKHGDNKIRIGGRLQYDTTFVGTDGDYSGNSESQLRRARIYLSGTWAKLWDFKFQYDIEDTQDGDQAIEDAYIKYKGFPVHITLGQRKTPYSMSAFTSSKYIAFVERSFVSGLFNSGSLGVGNRGMGVTFTWDDMKNSGFLAEGGFYTLRAKAGAERALDDGNGMTGRIVWADYDKKARHLWHVGTSFGYRNYANNEIGRIRVRPGVSEGDRILDTDGALNADSYMSYNFNAAFMHNRFWADAEYFYGSVELASDAVDDNMQGYIIQAGAFLTSGDSRRYKNGAWDAVKVRNPIGKDSGIGAWEIALRYDYAELGSGLHTGSNNEEGSTLTAALNFYPIDNLRFQANYIRAMCDECAWKDGDPEFFILRAQTFF